MATLGNLDKFAQKYVVPGLVAISLGSMISAATAENFQNDNSSNPKTDLPKNEDLSSTLDTDKVIRINDYVSESNNDEVSTHANEQIANDPSLWSFLESSKLEKNTKDLIIKAVKGQSIVKQPGQIHFGKDLDGNTTIIYPASQKFITGNRETVIQGTAEITIENTQRGPKVTARLIDTATSHVSTGNTPSMQTAVPDTYTAPTTTSLPTIVFPKTPTQQPNQHGLEDREIELKKINEEDMKARKKAQDLGSYKAQ